MSIPHLCTYQAEERGSVMDFKYLSPNLEPQNLVQAMIMYIWFGAGSVPWISQGKYVLAQLLFLFAGVIVTHQLDVMYVLLLSAIISADPHLNHLSHTYSVWSLCIKGVPYLCTILCEYYCTIGLTFDNGPVGKQVLIPPKDDHVGTAKNSHRSPTAFKRAKAWRDLISRNWYVLINWSNPLDWIGKDRISGQNVCPLIYLGSRRSCMRIHVQRPPMGGMDPRVLGDIKLGDIKT